MLSDEQLRVINRVYRTQDGKDFVEVLKYLTAIRYLEILKIDKAKQDMLIGQSQQLFELIALFESSEQKLHTMSQTEVPERF